MTPRPPHAPLVPPGSIDPLVADMTVIASADVTLAALQSKLQQFNQWLPVDGPPDASLGQLVTSNSTGPLRIGFGGWRDLLLGIQFLDGQSNLLTVGGRVVKNVAGYDVTKFLVGSFGVFGRPVTVTTRTYLRPTHALLARFAPEPSLIGKMLTTSARPTWAMLTRDDASPLELLLGYLGDAAAIEFFEKTLGAYSPISLQRQSLDDDIALRAARFSSPSTGHRYRASVPPGRLVDFARIAPAKSFAADAVFGIATGTVAESEIAPLRQSVASFGGTVTVFDSAGTPLPHDLPEAQRAILRKLKVALDPQNTLAPLSFG